MAARKATSDTPIVMAGVGDALRCGLVASLAFPGGRVTGVTLITQDVAAKGLEMLKDLSPRATRRRLPLERHAALQRGDLERRTDGGSADRADAPAA